MDGIDHRWGHRITVNIPVTLAAQPGVATTGVLESVSISGAWIETQNAPPGVTLFRVNLPSCRDTDNVTVDVIAWVVRRTERGIAVEWGELAPPCVRHILAIPAIAMVRANRQASTHHG